MNEEEGWKGAQIVTKWWLSL